MQSHSSKLFFVLLLLLTVTLASQAAFAGATITIVNGNAPGVGFNDPTPAAPVGGNTGTTLGQQRLNAFQYAANTWGANLDSNTEIFVLATFEPLTCTATSAVLGSAGTIFIFSDFTGEALLYPGAEFANTWYHSALADKRAGAELNEGQADIRARFNVNLGNVGCLTGTGWYLGLDGNHGSNIDLVTVLLHEFAHGLGFSQFASVTTGSQISGLTDVYGRNLFDKTLNKHWNEMTNAERQASAINSFNVVWTGNQVTDDVPGVLSPGTPLLTVNAPGGIAGTYAVGAAAFGPVLSSPGITGDVVIATDAADVSGPSTSDACTAITNAADVAGKIALVDRGTCAFVIKVKNAQNAGAIAVLVADNVAGSPPAGLGGADPTITIPSARITLADGNLIKANLPGVNVTLGVNLAILAGADSAGKALLNAPNPVQSGSSISHWDPIAFPNQLMEPAINSDLTHGVAPPADLTLSLFRDVGWFPDGDLDGLANASDSCPNSDLSSTVVIGSTNTGVNNTLFTSGCTIKDLFNVCPTSPRGQFTGCVARVAEQLLDAGAITSAEKDTLVKAAAKVK